MCSKPELCNRRPPRECNTVGWYKAVESNMEEEWYNPLMVSSKKVMGKKEGCSSKVKCNLTLLAGCSK